MNNNNKCNPIDIKGNLIKNRASLEDYELFGEWIESIFDNQTNFAKRCGYSRKAINQFCQGRQPIPQALLLVWKISLQNERIKQDMARLKRGMK